MGLFLRPIFDYERVLGLYRSFDYQEVVDGFSYMAIGLWDYMLVDINDIYRRVLNFECADEEFDIEVIDKDSVKPLQKPEIICVPEPSGFLLSLIGFSMLAIRRKTKTAAFLPRSTS